MSLNRTVLREVNETSRFWYWFGASGRRYIHSIYPVDACPPLPGAIYVAVKRIGDLRTVLGVGRFPVTWDVRAGLEHLETFGGLAADEIHVHLLAKGEAEAEAIACDLRAALKREEDDRPYVNSLGLAA